MSLLTSQELLQQLQIVDDASPSTAISTSEVIPASPQISPTISLASSIASIPSATTTAAATNASSNIINTIDSSKQIPPNSNQSQQQLQVQQQNQHQPYTIAGILHYIQYEWNRVELERQQWEVEKAELTALVALLQGEKKSHENIKRDLVRRIKMLEYCLKSEREKYDAILATSNIKSQPSTEDEKTKSNDDNNKQLDDISSKQPTLHQQKTKEHEQEKFKVPDDISTYSYSCNASTPVKYSKEKLREYLAEIGCTDTIIDAKTNRFRSLYSYNESIQPQPPLQIPQPNKVSPTTEQPNSIVSTPAVPNIFPNSSKNDPSVDIGELAKLTTIDTESNTNENPKKQWTTKYELQSHLDGVRALCFCENDSLLVTASDDETVKLWQLNKPLNNGKSKQVNVPPSLNLDNSILDLEPLHTFRGHTNVVLCLAVHDDVIYSGSLDGQMILWSISNVRDKLKEGGVDQYDVFDQPSMICKKKAHNDALWSLEVITYLTETYICSCGADNEIKLWNNYDVNLPALVCIKTTSSPTCIANNGYQTARKCLELAISFSDGKIRFYDLEWKTNSSVINFVKRDKELECSNLSHINSIVIHPTLPYLVSAHKDRKIRFWDLTTREFNEDMVAHLEEVTGLAFDPSGDYLLSASHDGSVRLWNFDEKKCIQEIPTHRKKFDESVLAVAFHPTLSHFATAGADGLAKVFM